MKRVGKLEGWKVEKLGDVCEIVNGSTPLRSNKSYWDNGDISWFTIDDIRIQGRIITETKQKVTQTALEESSLRMLPINAVLLCCTASVGEYAITEIPLATNQQFNGLVVKNKKLLSPYFLFHFCATLKDKLLNLSGKTTIDFIPISRLRELEIPIPPLPEQQRIVSLLDEAFESIAGAKVNAERNLVNARELFESVLAEIFGNGEDWEEKKLGDVLQKTETIDPTKTPNKEYVYIDVSSVNKENLSIEEVNLIKGKDAPSRARKLIKTNDVIFATVRPTLRRIAIVPEEYDNQICSTGYFVLRGKEFIDNVLIFYFLQTNGFMEKMEKLQKGASYPAVTDGEVRDQIIHYPKSLAEQRAIVARLDVLAAETRNLEGIYGQKVESLDELKKSVLSKAFGGEL